MTPTRSGATTSITSALTACALAWALMGSVVAAPTSFASSAAGPSLSVSPSSEFVAGQAQTYRGNIGAPGTRRIWLESHLNRPGDAWTVVEGTTTTTSGNGDFSFARPAPSMFGISFRVAAKGGLTTPGVTLSGATQEVFIWAASDAGDDWTEAIDPAVGEPFTVVADTTPEQLNRTDLRGLPAFPGRTLTLQRRTDGQSWQTVAATTSDADGIGVFGDVVETTVGPVVYRVRAERIYRGADRIGWHASFPLEVTVGEQTRPHEWWTSTPTSTFKSLESGAATTAAKRFGWNPRYFDFDWELGQDLDEKPSRGTKPSGRWIPYSDGSGRGSVQNGQLVLFSSMSGRSSTGDHGTVRLTQSGNARKRGRWEVRMRWQVLEEVARDYRLRVELVPQGTPGEGCAPSSIVLGTWAPRSRTVEIGVAKDGRTWKAPVSVPDLHDRSPALAVEVGKKHTTWFVNGKPVGTLKGTKGQLGKKLVLRLSLEGESADLEHNSTKVFSDWQRGFGLTRGKQTIAAAKVRRSGGSLCSG